MNAIVKVGHGRGFLVEGGQRYVITAAHCLPHLPPAIGGISYPHERTYEKLVGPLGRRRPSVWAECLFVDPVADIAVLGKPEVFYDEAEAYDTLVEGLSPIPIGQPSWRKGEVHEAS